jgi:hypothetical protein
MKNYALPLYLLLTTLVGYSAEIVSWDANPPEDVVTGYKVFWSTNSAAVKPWTVLTNTPLLTASGSTNTVGKNYYYVTAVNSIGESDPSAVSWRINTPANLKVR